MVTGKADQTRSILRQGANCWRVVPADRASVLIDAASYFGALRESLLKATSTVFIVGWDVDSRTRLVGPSDKAEDGLPEHLGLFLSALVKRRPTLKVHILLWDYAMLYALDREPLPTVNLNWKLPRQISVCLDDVLPVGASHHQKTVVIDDKVAFSGGIDVTTARWDTSEHVVDDDRRTDPSGDCYRPFHDLQMVVDGDAATALSEMVRARWQAAACETPPSSREDDADRWPESVEPDFFDVRIGIARTLGEYDGRPEIREVEDLYVSAIESAEREIYIENQFLTVDRVARALVRRMRDKAELETLIVGPNVQHGWLEERTMNAGRRRFMETLESGGIGDRVRLLYPALPDDETGEGVMVHAKVMIVDDRLLRVGSANLNNRSMGFDTECDIAIEPGDGAQRERVLAIRNRLLAEHLGTDADAVAAALSQHGSLLKAVDALATGERTLKPIELSGLPQEFAEVVTDIADPEKPMGNSSFFGDLFGGSVVSEFRTRILRLLALLSLVVGLAALWRFSPLASLLEPDALLGWLDGIRRVAWAPVAIPLLFVLAGLLVFPLTILIAVMGLMFTPLTAFAYSMVGAVLSGIVVFLIGAGIGRSVLRDRVGIRVNRISRALAAQGVMSVAVIRLLPVAPYTLVNLVAGASHIRFIDYVIGTILGLAPGIVVLSLVGRQLRQMILDPTTTELLILAAGVFGWLALSVLLQFVVTRLRRQFDA